MWRVNGGTLLNQQCHLYVACERWYSVKSTMSFVWRVNGGTLLNQQCHLYVACERWYSVKSTMSFVCGV